MPLYLQIEIYFPNNLNSVVFQASGHPCFFIPVKIYIKHLQCRLGLFHLDPEGGGMESFADPSSHIFFLCLPAPPYFIGKKNTHLGSAKTINN